MSSSHSVSITPEQLAAVNAGRGCAEIRDPNSDRHFILVEQIQPALSEEYFREKVTEGLKASEQGETAAWDLEAVRAEAHRRIAQLKSQS